MLYQKKRGHPLNHARMIWPAAMGEADLETPL
jgi:hypothetical protein